MASAVAEVPHHGRSLALRATDLADGWTVTLDPGGYRYRRATAGVHTPATHVAPTADVTVEGAAGDLLLLTYGRLPPHDARFATTGDGGLLSAWLEASAL